MKKKKNNFRLHFQEDSHLSNTFLRFFYVTMLDLSPTKIIKLYFLGTLNIFDTRQAMPQQLTTIIKKEVIKKSGVPVVNLPTRYIG